MTQITGEAVPIQANIVARRRTTSLFGLGLVEAIPGSAIQAESIRQATFSPLTAGKVNIVTDLRSGQSTIGRFGWKSQIGNLYDFSVYPSGETHLPGRGNLRLLSSQLKFTSLGGTLGQSHNPSSSGSKTPVLA